MFIERQFECNIIARYDINIETCPIKLKIALIQYNIVAIYRPHSGDAYEFYNALSSSLKRILNSYNKLFLVGDFNGNIYEKITIL